MRHLKRFQKPDILAKKEKEWTENFIKSGNSSADSSKYAHPQIKEALEKISFNKCFYSEVKFPVKSSEVDHYVEVAEDKTKAYEWENLYLSCDICNRGKTPNKKLPNVECLDPFIHTDEEIEEHLDFEDEYIKGKTERGLNTIQKYGLDKNDLNILRREQYRVLYNKLDEIVKERRVITDEEIGVLKTLSNPDRPFSLMFRIKFKKLGFL